MAGLKGRPALIALFAIAFLGTFAGSLLRVVTAATMQEKLGSLVLTGLLVTAFMCGRAVSAFVFSSLSDKIVKYNLLAFAGFLVAALTALLHLWLSVEVYHALRILFGVACGASWPIAQRLVLEHSLSIERHRATSIYFAMGMLGVTLSYAVFSFMSNETALVLATLLFLFISLCMLAIAPEKKKLKPRSGRRVANPPPLSSLALASFAFGGLVGVLSQDFLVGLALIKFHTRVGAGLALTLASVVGIALSYLVGWIVDKTGSRRVVRLLAVISPLFVGAIIVAPTPESFILSVGATRAALSALRPQIIAMAKASEHTGVRIGVVNSLTNIATAGVPPLLGAISASFGLVCAFVAVTELMMVISSKAW